MQVSLLCPLSPPSALHAGRIHSVEHAEIYLSSPLSPFSTLHAGRHYQGLANAHNLEVLAAAFAALLGGCWDTYISCQLFCPNFGSSLP